MQQSIFRGLVAAVALCAAGQALAGPGVTLGPINMRVAPRAGAPVVMQVPPDAQVDVEWCRDGWCAISWRYQQGFAPARWIGFEQPVYAPPPPPPPVYVVPGPVWGPGYGHGYGHRHW